MDILDLILGVESVQVDFCVRVQDVRGMIVERCRLKGVLKDNNKSILRKCM